MDAGSHIEIVLAGLLFAVASLVTLAPRIGLPRRVVVVVEGEALTNDGTASGR